MLNSTKEIVFTLKNANPSDITVNQFEFLNYMSIEDELKSMTSNELSSTNPDLFSNEFKIRFLFFEPIKKYMGSRGILNRIYINRNAEADYVSRDVAFV